MKIMYIKLMVILNTIYESVRIFLILKNSAPGSGFRPLTVGFIPNIYNYEYVSCSLKVKFVI